eukprot:403367333
MKKQFTQINEENEIEDVQNNSTINVSQFNHRRTDDKSRNQVNASNLLKAQFNTIIDYESLPLQQAESMFKDVDSYMIQQTLGHGHSNGKSKENELRKQQTNTTKDKRMLNFCSPIYKKQKREFEHRNRKGYLSLVNKIKESAQMVSHIKTGKSLFQNSSALGDYHIPVFKEQKLKQELQDLINKSQDEISVKASKQNLSLMECLSPQKLVNKINNRGTLNNSTLGSISQFQTELQINKMQEIKLPSLPQINRRRSSLASVISTLKDTKQSSDFKKSLYEEETVKVEFANKTYSQKLEELNQIKKSFDFPNNPAYLFKNVKAIKKLKYLSDYCRENQIAMSKNEEIIMNLDLSKLQHNLWKNSVSDIYDYKKNMKTDEDQLIDDFKNFGKVKLAQKLRASIKTESVKQPRSSTVMNTQNTQKWTLQVQDILKKKESRKQSHESNGGSDRNSISSSSKKNSTSKNSSYYYNNKSTMMQSRFVEKLNQLQSDKKAKDEVRFQDFMKREKVRQDKLQELKKQLENPYLLKQTKKSRPNRQNMNLQDKMQKSISSSESENTQRRAQSQMDYTKDKKFKRKPIIKLIKTTEMINKGKNKINKNLLRLIERLDLDRPLMLKEKLDIIWKSGGQNNISTLSQASFESSANQSPVQDKYKTIQRDSIGNLNKDSSLDISIFNSSAIKKQKSQAQNNSFGKPNHLLEPKLHIKNLNQSSMMTLQTTAQNISQTNISQYGQSIGISQKQQPQHESLNLRVELEKKKQERMHLNNHQRDCYNKLLSYLEKRGKAILSEEKQFMNIIKIVIDGGWIVREQEFVQIIGFIEFKNLFGAQYFEQTNDKVKMTQEKDLLQFFETAIEYFQFNPSIIDIIREKGENFSNSYIY